jgi:hypothetical protein
VGSVASARKFRFGDKPNSEGLWREASRRQEFILPDEERLLTYQQFAKIESRSGIHSVNALVSIEGRGANTSAAVLVAS